jgi:hypothetical protein
MKKKAVLISLLVVLSLPLMAQSYFATILKSVGTVLIKPSGENDFNVIAETGMGLHVGDAVMTSEDGYVAVIFTSDKSLLKIRKNSEVTIREDLTTKTIKMSDGRLLAEVTPGTKGTFRIETPTSVASVKGTSFWTVVSKQFGDRFYGVQGDVNVLNLITGIESIMAAGQMVISTPQGQLLNMPVDPADIPQDIEPEVPQPEEEMEIQPEEQVYKPEQQAPAPPTEAPAPAEKPAEGKAGKPFGMGLGLGSVTIDNKIYNQIALRPEFAFGKLGVALDIAIYMDDQGNIRKNEWDEVIDYFDKIYYVRWAQPGDPFFVKLGALDNVNLGYGILMNGYSNTTEYPQVRKVGVHTGMQFKRLGWEFFTANAKEITGPGLMAGRVTFRPLPKLPLVFGGTVVTDVFPYKGLPDADEDEVPDALDIFPDKDDNKSLKSLSSLSLSDRQLIRDSGVEFPSDYLIDHGITKLSDYDRLLNGAVAVDVGMPVLNSKLFNVVVYGQAASFIPVEDSALVYSNGQYDRVAFTPGFGFAVPGVRTNMFKIVNLTLEYRYAGENFLFNFWDRAYDYERVQIRDNQIFTKQQMRLMQDQMQGIFGAFDVNVLNYVILGSYYQHMFSSGNEIKSFMASASLPKGKIPKLASATAFYQRNNDENPFDFKNPSENTILGYKVGFELGGGAVIYYVFQRTYRDFDGNGKIDPKTESVSLTTIETGFSF